MGAKHWLTCLVKGGANKMAGRDGKRQTMVNSSSKGGVGVTIGHQLMSTCQMAALGPPRDPTDTNTWSGGDNQPSTDVYLPNGHIRPSKRSHRYQHMEGG